MDLIIKKDSNFIEDFLKHFSSKNTKKAYTSDLKEFFTALNFIPTHPEELTINIFIRYKEILEAKKLAPKSVNRKLAALRSLMRWCQACGLITHNPLAALKISAAPIQTPTLAFSDLEVRKMILSTDPTTFHGSLHRIIAVMMFNLGLRRSELVTIKMKDIYEDRGTYILKILGKGNKERLLPLNENVLLYLNGYSNDLNLGPEDYLLQSSAMERNKKPFNAESVNRIIKRIARECNIDKKVTSHSCRATAISHLLEQGISPRDVADFAGHSDVNTTIQNYDKKRDGISNSAAYKIAY